MTYVTKSDKKVLMAREIPAVFDTEEFVYVIKKPTVVISEENFHDEVQSGSVIGSSAIESLLR